MIQFDHVSKSYSGHQALNDVSFTIPKGTIFGLLGPNGAGKTTLLRILTRMLLPDAGQVTFDGQTLSDDFLQRMGYLPEERGLYPKMRVDDHLIFLASLKGLKKAQIKERLQSWGTKLQLEPLFHRKVEGLSKGQQQKVQLLSALLHEPDLLILDEPFSGFDPISAELLKAVMRDLKAAGRTLLISTHRMENAEELCDELVIVNKGKIMVQGDLPTVLSQHGQQRYRIGMSQPLKATDAFEILQQGPHEALIQTKGTVSPNQLLQVLMAQGEVLSFAPARKTLREVFLETALG